MNDQTTKSRSIPLTVCVAIIFTYNAVLTGYAAFQCVLVFLVAPPADAVNQILPGMGVDLMIRLCLLGTLIGILRGNNEAIWFFWIFVFLLMFWSMFSHVSPGSLNLMLAIVLTVVHWMTPADRKQFQ